MSELADATTRGRSAADHLAAEKHLAVWAERNRERQGELQERLVGAALPCDLTATVRIARWVYRQAEQANGQVWVEKRVLERLSPAWPQCLSA